MKLQSYIRENQINELATTIRDVGNTTVINVYAIQDKNTGCILNHRNNMFYITRKQARDVRRSIGRDDIKIVKTTFVNLSPWETAK
jgi:hypothetical protein